MRQFHHAKRQLCQAVYRIQIESVGIKIGYFKDIFADFCQLVR
ncbi:hypothetical protein ENHYD8BJ_130223 [Enhydrobacter sp. 8BJ]|nr:hypothetical protein ENHYD8BJ_130223 [Enhydrobacter sp. 8BJ]